MFDCQKTREFIDLYLDNELESVPTKHLAEHLERCAECRREFDVVRSQNELLASSIRDALYDTAKLRTEIEKTTVGKAALRLPEFSLPRRPVWILALGCSLIVLSVLFYLPGRMSTALAHPLYRAAATDHRACAADSAASNWIRSQPGISELATSFLKETQNVPSSIGAGYRLVRARICKFDGVSFLHVIYETADGRHVSLFLGRRTAGVPTGELTETVDGRDLQVAHISALSVFCAEDGNQLVFAAAPDDNVARSALLQFLGR